MAFDALAARRSLRIAFFAWSEGFSIPGDNCPGAAGTTGQVNLLGSQFSGDQGTNFLVDAYCQDAFPHFDGANDDEYLNAGIFESDEAGLAAKIGANTNNAITARRYTFLDCDRFECFDTQGRDPLGFQWAFYFFPASAGAKGTGSPTGIHPNITIVALYGLEGVALSSQHHFISALSGSGEDHWNGERDGYDGEYFCFRGNEFIGFWDGSIVAGGPAAGCVIPVIPKTEIISCSGFEDFNPPPDDPAYCGQSDSE